jgi:prepilin-type N-terminal cleavage/methylation domain-containing protein
VSLRARRPGFSLIEVIVAMTMVVLIMSIATRFFMQQTRMLSNQSGRLEAQQNAQFSLATLDREIRVAGIGVVDAQPLLVQAAPRAITFNADLGTRVTGDPSAVYVDADVDSASTLSFRWADETALPLASGRTYPDTDYFMGAGVPSRAETISFWVAQDSSSKDPQEYLLYRRINGAAPRVVARSLRVKSTDTVFQYFRKDTAGNLFPVGPGQLPLYHSAKIHGSAADTGLSALSDSIKAVRVRMTAMYKDRNGVQIIRRIDMTIQLMNAGLIHRSSCGEAPLGVSPTATVGSDPDSGDPLVTIAWARSGDEGVGEKDVERYSIFKRASDGAFAEPIASVPAGSSTYAFVDRNVLPGDALVYGVTAQDCTPAVSSMASTGAVTIPVPPQPED